MKFGHNIEWEVYTADVGTSQRQEIQMKWMKNQIKVIIATVAFGMGINKKGKYFKASFCSFNWKHIDVRYIIHANLPNSIENYSQECGRAGRDGKPAHWIMYYSYSDRSVQDFLYLQSSGQRNSENNIDEYTKNKFHLLYKFIDFIEEPYLWRRRLQLNLLGELYDLEKCSSKCDNCKKNIVTHEHDITNDAKMILNFISSLRIGYTLIQMVNILAGSEYKYLSYETVWHI